MNASHRTNRQNGFTLIEILVAVLILSLGLLGLAGLQAASIRSNHSAYLRSQATQLAYDMADRMRANIVGFDKGLYDNATPVNTPSCVASAGCSDAAMAQFDVFWWTDAVATLLPAGAGVVCRDTSPNDGTPLLPGCDFATNANYVVKIWWSDAAQNPAGIQRFNTTIRP